MNSTVNANINIRVAPDLKEDFYNVLDEIGLTATSAFNVFMKAVVRTGSIPFPLKTDKAPDYEQEALDVLNNPETVYYDSAEELAKAKGWI